jgi:3-hexulose-6-phosphate synthase/6-phospho-3-hexuloisomerase
MGDNLGMPEAVAGARLLAEAGCDYIIHHIAFDLRTLWKERGRAVPSPLDQLHSVVEAVDKPVQAVGGLSIEQAIETPKYGAPLVVIGAPLAIDPSSFRTASGDVERALRQICEKVHAYGDIPVGMERRS